MTTANSIKTWKEARDFTFKTRHTWRHGSGAITARYNTAHFTRLTSPSLKLSKINQALMTQVCLELESEGKSDATINRVVSAVSTVLNHCAVEGLIASPPKFRRRKEDEGRILFYTKDEVGKLIQVATDIFERQDLADIIATAAYTGMRQGELLKLRVRDIDLHHKKIMVGGEKVVRAKAGNVRAIPFHPMFEDVITKRCEQSDNQHQKIFGDDWIARDQLLRVFKKVNNCIGKDDSYVFHCLRHSFATWHCEGGTPIRTVMALMGHKNIETTLRYSHVSDETLKTAMASI